MPGDEAILDAARQAIRALNERAARAGDGAPAGDRFFLLHRERRWNPPQGVWMGWERKRGKLEEFNDLLRDPDAETSFVAVEGDLREATAGDAVRYVLTLDADTRTTPDAARALVATAAHPLNRPRYCDPRAGASTEGYGVFQPRVSRLAREQPPDALRAHLRRPAGRRPLHDGRVGRLHGPLRRGHLHRQGPLRRRRLPRTRSAGRVPENAILSHDLLEGNYARAALATDIEVFDDFPSRYASFAARLHRWVRGDWQLLPWLMPRVRDAGGAWRRNPLSVVGRWKLFDNLRRSLTPPAILVFLLLAWTVLPGSPFVWTLIALFVLAFPIYAPAAHGVLFQPPDTVTSSWLRAALGRRADARPPDRPLGRLPGPPVRRDARRHRADALAHGRLAPHLLEWTTAQQAEAAAQDVPALDVGVGRVGPRRAGLGDVHRARSRWITALPFAAAWIAGPVRRAARQPPARPATPTR